MNELDLANRRLNMHHNELLSLALSSKSCSTIYRNIRKRDLNVSIKKSIQYYEEKIVEIKDDAKRLKINI